MGTEDNLSWQRSARLTALSAAAMYAGAALLGLIEALTPGGAAVEVAPTLTALLVVAVIVRLRARLSRRMLVPLGPAGTVMVAYVISAVPGAGDGAVLYTLPVVWMAYFYGRRGAVAIVLWTAVTHAIALLNLPGEAAYLDRWIDVVVVMSTLAAVVSFLSERDEQLAKRLTAEARRDMLTNLLNRRGFEELVPLTLAHAARDQTSLAIVSFDLDHFKCVNDEWGHQAGDRVLVAFSKTLQECARATDLVARIGGEEFIALLPEATADEAANFAERVRHQVTTTTAPNLPSVTVSAGVTSAIAPDQIEPLLRDADYALYAAKASGRNQTIVTRPAHAISHAA